MCSAPSHWHMRASRSRPHGGRTASAAGAGSCAARVFGRWTPLEERGRAQGIFFAGAHLAGGLTPALVVWIATSLPWRLVFVLFGFAGLAWATCWYYWFRDEP